MLVNWGVTGVREELTKLCAAGGRVARAEGGSCWRVPRDGQDNQQTSIPSHSLVTLQHTSASSFQFFHPKNEIFFIVLNACNDYVDNTLITG